MGLICLAQMFLACSQPAQEDSPNNWSEWGATVNGVQCRADLPKTIEHYEPIKAVLQCRPIADKMLEGIRAMNPCGGWCTNFSIHLFDDSKKEFVIKGDVRTFGLPPRDDSGQVRSLENGEPVEWSATFSPLRPGNTPPPPGSYRAFIQNDQAAIPYGSWTGPEGDWSKRGYWRGVVESAPAPIFVLAELEKKRTIFVPKRLRLARISIAYPPGKAPPVPEEPFLVTTFTREDAEEKVVSPRNGHWIGTSYRIETEGDRLHKSRGLHGGPLELNLPIDHWLHYNGGNIDAKYAITIFETCADNPRSVGPRSCGYRVLWQGNLELHATAEEVQALPVQEMQIPSSRR